MITPAPQPRIIDGNAVYASLISINEESGDLSVVDKELQILIKDIHDGKYEATHTSPPAPDVFVEIRSKDPDFIRNGRCGVLPMGRSMQAITGGLLMFPPSPPGDTIGDIMQERGISRRAAARRLNISGAALKNLLTGKFYIDNDMACRLSEVFGSTPVFWENREKQYRESQERRSPGRTVPQ